MSLPPSAARFAFSSPAEALVAACAELAPLDSEAIDAASAQGRVLAQAIRADRDSPALDVSSMDGFAVRLDDLAVVADATRGLPLGSADAAIGRAPVILAPRTAVRIVTGAPVPLCADAVIRLEDAREESGRVFLTTPASEIALGLFIRKRGENATAGAVVLADGTVLGAAAMAVLGAVGAATLSVRRRARVAIITTGDELVGPGIAPDPWQLRDSNGPSLAALFCARRWIDCPPARRIADDLPALQRAVAEAIEASDAVVLTGGVSMGHRDFVPEVIRSLGGRVLFHRLPQRPGKPMLMAVVAGPEGRSKPVFGLPGNPVSVLVTARRIALPAIGTLAGISPRAWAPPRRVLVGDDGQSIALWWHRLVHMEESGDLRLVPGKSSGDVVALGRSHGFVELPPQAAGRGPWPFYGWDDGAR